jgi:hypothetical protein
MTSITDWWLNMDEIDRQYAIKAYNQFCKENPGADMKAWVMDLNHRYVLVLGNLIELRKVLPGTDMKPGWLKDVPRCP